MKQLAKNIIKTALPKVYNHINAQNNRKLFQQKFAAFQQKIGQQLYPNNNIKVLTGPFKGVRYFNEIVWGSITPKWLGSYECELWTTIENIIQRPYHQIIDVGCAEGYYVVGLAHQMPDTQFFAFDIDPFSRKQLQRLIQLNAVEKSVNIGKKLRHQTITQIINAGRTLLICDIEGYEMELLQTEKCSALKQVDILVELHDLEGKRKIQDALMARFRETHHIQIIPSRDRTAWIEQHHTLPIFDALNPAELKQATDEQRAMPQNWLWMECLANHQNQAS